MSVVCNSSTIFIRTAVGIILVALLGKLFGISSDLLNPSIPFRAEGLIVR
jgi:hypothetical protein